MSAALHRDDLVNECFRLRKFLQPISDAYLGSVTEASTNNTLLPFVLLLGNHSSGKSSFINFIVNRPVQSTGVAPTDDGFTIICPADTDADRSGPTFTKDPDFGFDSLQFFGSTLVNHTVLKLRSNIANSNFMIVDSPGMIDSSPAENNTRAGRGYDFESVCRWYAERADVILLFFDPDKPGTTGETLSIMTSSLRGLDHKLFIVFNKADQFIKINDFARAYGNLCWNLSRVFNRKDMPPIYSMCLPTALRTAAFNHSESLQRTSSPNGITPPASPSPPHAAFASLAPLEVPSFLSPAALSYSSGAQICTAEREKERHQQFLDKVHKDFDEARCVHHAFRAPR
jgi:hypothetical protein